MKKKNIIFFGILGIVVVLIFGMLGLIYFEIKRATVTEPSYVETSEDGSFSSAFIQTSHSYLKNDNYMVSPYSVEIALSMLREGAKEESLEELNTVVPERSIKTLKVKDKVNVANAIFIKDIFKDDMKTEYMDALHDKYGAEVIYDPFKSPQKINDWAKKETNGMIPKILPSIDPDFVLGVGNAVAMEEEWKVAFECERTREYSFTKKDGTTFNTSMMFQTFEEGASYYKDEDVKAVILPYTSYNRNSGKKDEKGEQLDYIGILPSDIDSYVNDFSLDDMKKIVKIVKW